MSLGGMTYIAGDIGGTNSRLQLFQVRSPAGLLSPGSSTSKDANNHEQLLGEKTYPSQKYASLSFVIEMFLKETAKELGMSEEDVQPVACCLAVAGPVRANKATITNVNWVLDGVEMSKALNIPDVLIINDFVGIGYGLLALTRADIVPINDVPLADDAPKACIGAGTGLGEVYLTAGHMISSSADVTNGSADNSVSEYNVWASEGGHADFAPRDQLEFGLLEYFKKQERVTRVSVERIVSGLGIPKIYDYFVHLYPAEVNPEVTDRLRREDPGAVIAEFAENGRCNLCRQSIELFIKCYGAEAGNLALKTLPFGGLFIGGGIAPKLQSFMLRNNLFYEHFVKKGRMQTLLEKVPVFIVVHPAVGLLGAKVVCRRLLRRQGFLPGRGELASFNEATPHASSVLGENFVYPSSGFTVPENCETEVTLSKDGLQPERVVIRRRSTMDIHSEQQMHQRNPSASPMASAATPSAVAGRRWGTPRASHSGGAVLVPFEGGEAGVKSLAFRAGMLGGFAAAALSVGTFVLFSLLSASRKTPTGAQLHRSTYNAQH